MSSKIQAGLLGAALLLGPATALADIQPQGNEIRVNRRVDFRQVNPTVAFARTGAALVAWENDQKGIRGQFFDGGTASGAELTLVENVSPTQSTFEGPVVNHREPAVAFLANGRFVLAWTEERAFVRTTPFLEERRVEDQDIYVQRFGATGTPLAEKVRLNVSTSGFQHEPQLISRGGGFLAVWEDGATGRIVGRLLANSGVPTGDEIQISEAAGQRPSLAASANRILVVWDGDDGDELGVFARVLDGQGSAVGGAFRVNATTATRQARPRAAADARGNFFVAWQGEQVEIYRGFFYLYGRAVGSDGGLIGAEKRLYDGPLGDSAQISPALSATPDGHFLLSWLSWNSRGNFVTAGIELDAQGNAIGGGFWLAQVPVQRTFRELVAAGDEAGNLFTVWESSTKRGPSIGARRLTAD